MPTNNLFDEKKGRFFNRLEIINPITIGADTDNEMKYYYYFVFKFIVNYLTIICYAIFLKQILNCV